MLEKEIQEVKGVGEKLATSFKRMNIHTIRDLIYYFPRAHQDYSHAAHIADIAPGNVTLCGYVENLTTKRVRRGMHITEAVIKDDTGKISAIWFNQPYRADQLRHTKQKWLLSGQFGFNGRKYQLQNASVEKYSEKDNAESVSSILPVYRLTSDLKLQAIRKIMKEVSPLMRLIPDPLPPKIVSSEHLIPHADAVRQLHFPDSQIELKKAQTRIGFEELFTLLLAAELNRRQNNLAKAYHIPFSLAHAKEFVSQLPFELTDDQRRAIWQIIQDMDSDTPMNRMLQGDVGSGKTVVAAMVASLVARQGYQTAVLAPTEILASQHANTITSLLEPFGFTVALLTGSVKGAARRQLYDALKHGEVDIVVGTHAILQDMVEYHKLGFIVIDEQHRFGVKQRQKLLEKSSIMPHVLSMTATPIPRSLALTVYGELSMTAIRQKPKNRQKILTEIISPNSKDTMYEKIQKELESGRQVYVVCPLIDMSEQSEKKSVEEEYKKLQRTSFKKWRIGMLHGQLSANEKQAVMERFSQHEIDVLVCTTVIEVGVDVPNATVMVIENADQFGLAQAHQLRGRVGRGVHQSYCYLVSSDSKKPTRRMRELAASDDGFYLAEMDLEMRGPGEIYGRAQHGELNLKMANISDSAMVARVTRAVDAFLKSGEDLVQYKQLYHNIQTQQRITTLN